jgi:hypothetical protein
VDIIIIIIIITTKLFLKMVVMDNTKKVTHVRDVWHHAN